MKGPKITKEFPWDNGLLKGEHNHSHTATFLVVGSGGATAPFPGHTRQRRKNVLVEYRSDARFCRKGK